MRNAPRHAIGLACLTILAAALWLTRGPETRGRAPWWTSQSGVTDLWPGGLPPAWRGGPPGMRLIATGELPSTPPLPYTYRRIASLGDPAPDGGVFSSDFEISGLNNAGEAPLVSDDANGEALYFLSPNGIRQVASAGTPTPAGNLHGGVVWTPQAINNCGQVVWSGAVMTGESWTFFYDGRTGRQSVVARPGMPAPGGGLFLSGGRLRPAINNRGDIAFVAHVAGRRDGSPIPGVFLLGPEGMRVVAREGSLVHSGAVFTAAASPDINHAGAVVFHATTSNKEGLGVYLWEEEFITPIAEPGTTLGGGRETAGSPLHQAFHPQIDALGRVVFLGRTLRGDALYRWENGAITALVEPGDTVAGVGRLRMLDTSRRQPFRLNARGAVAFSGDVDGRAGIFVWEEGVTRCVALAGVRLPGVGVADEVGNLSPSSYPPAAGAGPRSTRGLRPLGNLSSTVRSPNAPEVAPGPPSSSYPYGGPAGYPYGAPYGGPVGYPYGYGGYSGSFGLAMSDDGKLLFAATVNGRQSVILATPKPVATRQDRKQASRILP